MRIPLSKVYRAFPDLDRFSDAECERYVADARRHHRLSEVLSGFVAVALSIVFCAVFASLVRNLWSVGPPAWRTTVWWDVVVTVFLIASITAGTMVGFVFRDLWLRWAIRTRLGVAKCEGCRYSLLGLPVRDGAVICPECGVTTVLAAIGLTPSDILAVEIVQPTSASPSDLP